jgi:hypothetical protein
MFNEIPRSQQLLDPEDRLIWKQARQLPGFSNNLSVYEDLTDSLYHRWYGSEQPEGLPKLVLNPKFWPSESSYFVQNYSEELELALKESWPKLDEDSIELTQNVLSALKLGSLVVADYLTLFYTEHQDKIDLIMMRFFASNTFEQGSRTDWLDEVEIADIAISQRLDDLFYKWRIDDPKLEPLYKFLGKKQILVGCRFFDYFFEGILKKSFEIASLRNMKDDEKSSADKGSQKVEKRPKPDDHQPGDV